MPQQEISGDAARALGLPTGDSPTSQPEVAGQQAEALGLPAGAPMPPTDVVTAPSDPMFDLRKFSQERLARIGINAISTPGNEARRNLQVARDLGADPGLLDSIGQTVDQFEKQSQQDAMSWKLTQLPRIAAWMDQGASYSGAIKEEIDKWGVLDWLFGKYEPDPHALERSQALMRGEPYTADMGVSQPPGWVLAYGKAAYSTATSIQTFAQMAWGDGKADKPIVQIKQERDVASAMVPGERSGVGRTANNIIGMVPLIGAGMVHPGAAFGLMYAESTGRNYEDFRLQGYDHATARDISNLIGFTTATIGSALGPWSRNKVLPQATAGSVAYLSNALAGSMLRKPSTWGLVKDLGLNVLSATGMNIAMATSEASIKEGFDSAKSGRPFNFSVPASAAASAADSWAEMLAISVVPAYAAHRERMARYGTQPQATPPTPEELRNQSIYENYEQRGQALRSLHAASELAAAAEAIKDSPFMKENPADARDLIQKLVAPRASQNVFIHPGAFKGMSDDAYARLGSPDLSQGRAGNIPVSIVDFLMHPDVESLLSRTAGGPDLLTLREATGIDLSQPINVRGLDIPDAQLDAFLAQEAARRRAVREAGLPLPSRAEIQSAVHRLEPRAKLQAAFREKETGRVVGTGPLHDADAIHGFTANTWDEGFVDLNGKYYSRQEARELLTAQGVVTNPRRPWARPDVPLYGEEISPPGVGTVNQMRAAGLAQTTEFAAGRRPAPVIPPEERPVPARQAKGWAEDAMSRVPSGELGDRANSHDARAADATRDALSAPADATGPSAEGRAARVRADANTVLRDTARQAMKEVASIGQELAKGSGTKSRELAYRAGQDLGQAHDALTEMLGAQPKRVYAAPDLSDLRDRLIREDKLSQDFDVAMVNRLLSQANPVGNLNLAELREVRKAMEQINSVAQAENTVLSNGVRVAKGMIFNDITDHLAKLPNLPPGQNSTLSGKPAKVAELRAMLNQPHTLFFKLGKIGDDLWFHGLIGGVAKEERMWGDVGAKLQKIEQSVPEALRATGDDVVPTFGPHADKWGARTRSDVWRLALHLGVEGADRKIAQAVGVDPTKLHDYIHDHLGRTPADARSIMKGLIEPHWRIFDSVWDEYGQHFRERGLAPPEKLKPAQLMVHGQEYQGGYGGRLQWQDLKTGVSPAHPASLEALLDTSPTASPKPDAGHLQERVEGTQGVPVLSWEGVGQSLRKEIHDIALRPFVEDAHKVFSDGNIRDLIADKVGKQALNEIYNPSGKTSFLHTVARGSVADVHTAQAYTRAVMNLQGRAAYSAFALNTRVLAGQTAHLVAAMPALGILPDHAAMGAQAAMNPDRRAWAHEQSQVLDLRWNDYQRRAEDLNVQMTGVEPGSGVLRETTDKLNWAAWREMDGFLSHAIWEMKYAQQTAQWRTGKGASHQDAVRAADKAVTMMMPAQDVYDQASFVRDRSVAGMSYLVRGFPNTLANNAAMLWWEARVSGKTLARPVAAAKFVGMVMAAEVLGKGIMSAGPSAKQDLEDWGKDRALAALFYPYMLADPTLAVYHALQGNTKAASRDMQHMMPPSTQLVASSIDDIGRLVQNGDEDAGLRAGAHLMGLVFKTPLPGKSYDLLNAAQNSSSPADAGKKALGYRQ